MPSVTIKDIALYLNKSHSTVSRALNDRSNISVETKHIVREAAEKLGYVLNLSARMMKGHGGHVLGLAIPDIRDDFYSRIANEFAAGCRRLNARMLLAITNDDPEIERNEIRGLLESRVSGIVATLTGEPMKSTLDLLNSVPSVQLVRRTSKLRTPVVCVAEEAGCRAAVEHLIGLGHRRIAYVGTNQTVSSGRDRVKGFVNAHRKHGIPLLDNGIELLAPREELGFEGVKRLVALRDRPTALVIGTSQLTVGGLTALQHTKIAMPGDISVVGYGDPAWFPLLTPPLTAVVLPVPAMVSEAIDQVMNLAQPHPPAHAKGAKRFVPSLVLRGSTAPPGD